MFFLIENPDLMYTENMFNHFFIQNELNLRYLHNILIHFPIAYVFLLNFLLLLWIYHKPTSVSQAPKYLVVICSFFLIFSNLTGRITARKIGLQINDPVWVKENVQISDLVLNHQLWGNLTTYYSVCFSLLFIRINKGNHVSKRMKHFLFFLSVVSTCLVCVTGLIGSAINQ